MQLYQAIKCTVIIYLVIPNQAWGQLPNMIPNPGFEKIKGAPEKWFYTGKDFDLVFEEWKSPTAASPDVYHEQIYVPKYWKDRGFDDIRPFRGKSKVGITMYGCNQGKLHCREYISVTLLDSLVIGQEYYLSMWVAPMLKGILVDEMQVAFDLKPTTAIDDRLLELKPFYNLPMKTQKDWQRIEVRFFAETEASCLTIGNFKNDLSTRVIKSTADLTQAFSYYYIDELTMFKIPPILPREIIVPYDSGILVEHEILLKDIYFDFDQVKLLPNSYLELNKLLKFLRDRPHIKINLIGHTDKIGTHEYNIRLSKRRAQAVADFLARHYIDPTRIYVKGMGYEKPVASNESEQGRQKNRRVVFEIRK